MLKNKIAINKENLLKDMSDIFVSCLEDCKVLKDKDFIQFINNKIQTNQEVFTIKNETGLKVEIMRKGFTVKQIQLNNKSFLMEYQDIDSYFTNNDIFLNSFVGPAAGRIEKGIVKFDNKEIKLKTDNNDNYMHGMNEK
jgi:galactose mutarotase-like enzyme